MNKNILRLIEETFADANRLELLEKFAELIVKDCLKICDDFAEGCMEDDKNSKEALGAKYVAYGIAKRFGVDE